MSGKNKMSGENKKKRSEQSSTSACRYINSLFFSKEKQLGGGKAL